MDHSSSWDWASSFRLHEAACLIAGHPCVSTKFPKSEDLPAEAKPVLIALTAAYVMWYQAELGTRKLDPSTPILEGARQSDGSLPPFQIFQLSGQLVSRKSLVNYLRATGRKSVYEFDLASKPASRPDPEQSMEAKNGNRTKPWEMPDPRDPKAEQPWYTPARYFARQLAKEDTTLLGKRNVLASKVSRQLAASGITKRGGKKPPSEGTVLKALANVTLS